VLHRIVDGLADLADRGLAQGVLGGDDLVIHDPRDEQDDAEHQGYDAGRLPLPHGPLPRLDRLVLHRGYADLMGRLEACFLDAYDTILKCDFSRLRSELPRMVGVAPDPWNAEYGRMEAALNAGQLTKAEGFAQVLRACGVEPRVDLVREIVDRDRELILASACLYDDVIPFLDELRSHGIGIAIISNCTEHTRAILLELGVTARADAVVLSCEVGVAKPAAGIFEHALDLLGVAPDAALFVDDQPAFCAGAAALGIGAVQIVRGELDGKVPAAGTRVVRSLPEVGALFWD
jgi:putative hydrolase of the HAD superfamily